MSCKQPGVCLSLTSDSRHQEQTSLTMFGVLPQGVRISESFSDFEEPTLLQPSPIPCWPSTLGSLSAGVIRGQGARSKVLVTSQGAGGITLELLRGCRNAPGDLLKSSWWLQKSTGWPAENSFLPFEQIRTNSNTFEHG